METLPQRDGDPTADEIHNEWGQRDHPDSALWRTLTVLPSDYRGYGGEIERWGKPGDIHADCSCGCLYARFLEGSGDWLVCANPDSPRLGLLTWEHQAGATCFVPEDDQGDDVIEEDDRQRRMAEAWRILMANVAEKGQIADLSRFVGILAERVGVPTDPRWYTKREGGGDGE